MQSIQIEPGTSGAQNLAASFFYKKPVDETRFSVQWQERQPTGGFDSSFITFEFSQQVYPLCYEISSLLLSVKFKIVDSQSNNIVPQATETVAGINNMLHSLFESVCLSLNGQTVSSTPDHYYYKAYLENLMTFDENVKTSWLQSAGFGASALSELKPSNEPVWGPNDPSVTFRNKLFRKDFSSAADYSEEGKLFKNSIQKKQK